MVLAFMALPSNQEDALVLKKSSIERGAMVCSTSRFYNSETVNQTNMSMDKFERPENVLATRINLYDNIQSNGFPRRGSKVSAGDVIIGKTRSIRKLGIRQKDSDSIITQRDISTVCKQNEGGIVSKVNIQKVPGGIRASVCISTSRPIDIGCKITTNHAQKGVVGAIWHDADMPFSCNTGIAPDIIASPLSLTSRKTMSSLLEALTGKVVAITGDRAYGVDKQCYSQDNSEHIGIMGDVLKANGFDHNGTEKYVDGRTGKMITAKIFTGIVDYYRLLHIAGMKLHSRSTGPRDALTRQPRDGRRFGGGLRVGEMESTAMAAHGVSHIHQTRFRELSDAFEVFVCNMCHLMVDDVNMLLDYQYCTRCDRGDTVRSVLMPFTFLVLMLELVSTGISMKLFIEDDVVVNLTQVSIES